MSNVTPPPPPPGNQPPPPPPSGDSPYGGSGQGPSRVAASGSVSVGDAFNFGWLKFQENIKVILLAMIGLGVVVSIFVAIVFLIVFTGSEANFGGGRLLLLMMWYALFGLVVFFIQAAIIRLSLAIADGKQIDTKMMFSTDRLGSLFVASILVAVLSTIGLILCIIPGFIFAFMSQFYTFFVIDKKTSPWESIKASIGLVNKNLGTFVAFYIVSTIVYFVGSVLLVGVLAAFPVISIAMAYMYRRGQGEPVAAFK